MEFIAWTVYGLLMMFLGAIFSYLWLNIDIKYYRDVIYSYEQEKTREAFRAL